MNYAQFVSRYQWNPNDPTHLLGEGGFGKVYLAYDTTLNRQVALKTSAVSQARESLTLKHEVDLVTTQLPHDHKNIVKYESCHRLQMGFVEYDVAVLQYYPEGNLAQLIARERLTIAQKSNIAHQILDGIAFYQSAGILHRDLKPSNILIAKTPTGEYVPKIGDFGISKAFEPDAQTRMTNTVKGGTLRFAAPEQLVGDKIGLNADLWSYGVLLYYLFLNELPITLPDASTASYEAQYFAYLKILKNWQLDSKVDRIPQPFQNWVKQCLVIDRQKRAQSVVDLNVFSPQTEEIKIYSHFASPKNETIEIHLEEITKLADEPNPQQASAMNPPVMAQMPPLVSNENSIKPPTSYATARFERVCMFVFLAATTVISICMISYINNWYYNNVISETTLLLQLMAQATFHICFFTRNLLMGGAIAEAKIRYFLGAVLSCVLVFFISPLRNTSWDDYYTFWYIMFSSLTTNYLYLKKVNEELSNA